MVVRLCVYFPLKVGNKEEFEFVSSKSVLTKDNHRKFPMHIGWFCGMAGIVTLPGLLRDSVHVLLNMRLLALAAHSHCCVGLHDLLFHMLASFSFFFLYPFDFWSLSSLFLLAGVMTPSH